MEKNITRKNNVNIENMENIVKSIIKIRSKNNDIYKFIINFIIDI